MIKNRMLSQMGIVKYRPSKARKYCLKTMQAFLLYIFSAGLCALSAGESPRVNIVLETALGDIEMVVYTEKAPQSAASFLAHVDNRLFSKHSAGFYRVVRPDLDKGSPKMDLIQGGLLDRSLTLPPVPHESTRLSGLSHTHGAVSLARKQLGTASGGAFFICIGDQSGLDFEGARSIKHEQAREGYAVFGRVVKGMDIVVAIQQSETKKQYLDEPVEITKVYRAANP